MHKIMCLDVGTKRIGLALSDYLHIMSIPHSWIEREPQDKAVEKIKKIAKENNVDTIVIGIPINMDGTYGAQAEDCKEFSKNFNDFKVVYEDERLTSDLAEERLRERKINFRNDKALVDIESACIILEQYLAR